MRPHAVAVFLGAFLLFYIQPLAGRWFLPWYGGSPAVWTVALLVFQALLLAGYALAHILTRLRPVSQVAVYGALVAAGWLMFPLAPSDELLPEPGADPLLGLLTGLVSTIGLSFLALAAASPLLQHWAARARQEPYRLYSVSNLGSFAALVSYPLLVEPNFTLGAQAAVAKWMLLALLAAVGWAARNPSASRDPGSAEAQVRKGRASLAWFALPAVTAALLMGVTNQISRDVAVVPFLWILPLGLFLLSFALAFSGALPIRSGALTGAALALLPFSGWLLWVGERADLWLQVAGFSATLFVVCWALNADLYRRRPEAARLTGFYLATSVGGALGGAFVALAAPRLFLGWYELHWALFAAGALLVAGLGRFPVARWRRAGRLPLIGGGTLVAMAGMLLVFDAFDSRDSYVERVRSFFGVHRVAEGATPIGEPLLLMEHGGITHGTQFVDPERRRVATTYYSHSGGGGLAWSLAGGQGPRRLGMVGLGAGTLLALARPGDAVTVYELDPLVEEFARRHFTYLADTPAAVEVRLGDARLVLAGEAGQELDLLVLDAFTGDAVPAHLLTREAFSVYARHLAPRGALAFHVTNRHLGLSPLVAALAEEIGWPARVVVDGGDAAAGAFASEWVVTGPPGGLADHPGLVGASAPAPVRPGLRPWTDDYAALLPLVRW